MKEAEVYLLSQVMLWFSKRGRCSSICDLSISIALQNFWISLTSLLDQIPFAIFVLLLEN